jgi:hypothetical protein
VENFYPTPYFLSRLVTVFGDLGILVFHEIIGQESQRAMDFYTPPKTAVRWDVGNEVSDIFAFNQWD